MSSSLAGLENNPCPRREEHPLKDAPYSTLGKDEAFYESVLSQNQSRLFEAGEFKFEILCLLHSNEAPDRSIVKIENITSMNKLNTQLCVCFTTFFKASFPTISKKMQTLRSQDESIFYLIPQLFSWGELQISKEAFQEILVYQHVFAPFLHIVNEFGSKIRHELPRCNTFYAYSHANTYPDSETESASRTHHDYELSYILQFVEKNGRNRGDPWSLRQTGVYQQATFHSRQSAWIFLQLSYPTRIVLENALRSQLRCFSESDSPMTLHALLLGATVDNWGEYVQDLSKQLRDVDEKACFAKIGTMSRHDYSITFLDMQTLQRLRHKILKTSLALSSCLDVATKLEEHCNTLDRLGFTPKSAEIEKAIHVYSADIGVHQRSVRVIMEMLQGTFDLLSNIIEFRNIESLRSIAEVSEAHMVFLKDLTIRIRNENCASANVAIHTYKDAKAMKALTTTATAFLPASLIATIFSSSLVQVKQDGSSDGHGTRLVIATQFWIYVVITLALTIFTLGCTRLLEQQWIKSLLH